MRRKVPETDYRASRICRVLGNPTAYQIIKLLSKQAKRPMELASELGVSIQTVSDALGKLRNIDLVRYEVKADGRKYWLKHRAIIKILMMLERLVQYIRFQTW